MRKDIFYLLSVSLQISGTFLLAYMGFTKNVKDIAEEIIGFNLSGKDIDSIPIPQVFNKLLEIYLTRIGFTLVFLGYILSIFGKNTFSSLTEIISRIIFITIIISGASILLIRILANKRKEAIEEECKNNLPPGTIFYHEID